MLIPATQNQKLVESIMRDASRLRAFPATANRAIQMLGDPGVNIQQLGQVLSRDQVIASQILRHANSAYYGGASACTTVADGIVRIGLRQLKSVLYGVAASGVLVGRLAGYQLKQGELFRHSMVVAAATRRLAAMLRYPDPEEAYTAGLLHDIGKLLLDKYVEPHYRGMAAEVERGRSLIEVEEQFVGTDHATIGGLVADLWSLPKSLEESIRFHHVPTLSTQPKLAALVGFANILVLQSGIGLTPLGIPPLRTDTTKYIAVKEDDLGQVAYILRPEIDSADAQFQAGAQPGSAPLAPQGSGLLARTQALRSK